MTGIVNLFDTPRAADEGDPPGYEVPYLRIGPMIGAAALGMTVYELNEGNSICPYHWESPDEEWLIVLEGRPTLRDPEGEHELEAGDLVCFPPGPDGAHKVTNRATDRALVAMLSTKARTALAVYPDSDKIGIWTGNRDDDMLVRRSSKVGYYDGEVPDSA